MNTRIQAYMPGDILFYTAAQGSLPDAAIAQWTENRFVHCAVAISAFQKIEALGHGVILNPINNASVAASWSYVDHAQPLVQENLTSALAWLHSMLGRMYGWGDILNAVLEKYEHGITVNVDNNLDCSGLVLEFLLKAGGIAVLQPTTDPHQFPPGAVARLLGVA